MIYCQLKSCSSSGLHPEFQVRDTGIYLNVDEEQINGGLHAEVKKSKRVELGSSLTTCEGYDAQVLLTYRSAAHACSIFYLIFSQKRVAPPVSGGHCYRAVN